MIYCFLVGSVYSSDEPSRLPGFFRFEAQSLAVSPKTEGRPLTSTHFPPPINQHLLVGNRRTSAVPSLTVTNLSSVLGC